MDFTWGAYKNLIGLLRSEGYKITDYHSYDTIFGDCVILRHDIDNSIEKAYEMAKLEYSLGVQASYFVLLTSEFYNVIAACNVKKLKEMHEMGHRIGLHFDEALYENQDADDIRNAVERERKLLESILEFPIREVSMHRPSKLALESNWKFDGMINSYGEEFFQKFKYLSDSRMHWREDVEKIIRSHQFDRLHILTHAIWYGEQITSMQEKVKAFLMSASTERWDIWNKNIRDLSEIVERKEIENAR